MTNVTTTGNNANIIPTFKSTIGGIPALCCDSRTLHAYLGNGKQFSDWFKQRCDQYGFEAKKDFELVSPNSEIKKVGRGGDRRSTDYHLSLNMAKELSMVENNEQGRAARRYFIECERKALEAAGQLVAPAHTDTIIPSEQQNLQELVDAKCKGMADQGKARAEVWSRLHHKFRVAKYSQLPRTQLTEAQLYIIPTATGAAPTSSLPTASLTALLDEFDIGVTARTANRMLAKAGIIQEMTRPSSRGTSHKFWSVTDMGLKYGKNMVSASNPKETQPHWYRDKFKELVRTHMVA